MFDIVQTGIGGGELMLTANRIALGVFFTTSGYHKLFNAERHASLIETFKKDQLPAIGFFEWFVPCVEFSAGLGCIAGILAPLAAVGLLAVCLVALCVDGIKFTIPSYHPLDPCDWICDLLYLPETWLGISAMLVICNPGWVW